MKTDTLYKVLQIFSPIIVAFITIWVAQLRWKKDGYLKRKIEIEIELNRKLIGLYTILEKAKSIINTKHQYNKEQILDLERTLYNLRNIVFDKKNDIYKLLNEYSLFRNDNLIDKIKEYYNEFYMLRPKGKIMFQLDSSTHAGGYLTGAEDEDINEALNIVTNLFTVLMKLKKSICKNFKNL